MRTNDPKVGEIISGRTARLYDWSQRLNGAFSAYQRIVNLVSLKLDDKVLDIGCGTGIVLSRLHARYGSSIELHGIDPSEDMIAIAKQKRGEGIDFQVGFAQTLKFSDDSLDWIICSLTTHHISTDIRKEMFREIIRVLRPGSKLLISDFYSPESFVGRIIFQIWMRHHAYISQIIEISNERMLKEAGLKIEKIEMQKPLSLIQHILAVKPI